MDFLNLVSANMNWERNSQVSILVEGEAYPSVMSILAAKALYKNATVLWFKDDFICLAVS